MAPRMTGSNFLSEVDRLRGVAILLVVVSHALVLATETGVGHVLHTLARGSTWMFVFVAGYLMAHLRDRYGYWGYLRRKLRNVISPYIVVVSLALAFGVTRIRRTVCPTCRGISCWGIRR